MTTSTENARQIETDTETEPESRSPLVPIAVILVIILVFLLIVVGLFNAFSGDSGTFFGGGPTATPRGVLSGNPVLLSFSDLDSDPFAVRDQYVRVTGRFFAQTPVACVPNKGPRPRWGLIADGLQMDGVGLRDLQTLVPEGAELTVDGVWRLYEGPLGCGKEPPVGTLWYLEAQRVYQPNPLLFDNFEFTTPFARVGNSASELGTSTPTPTVDPNATATAVVGEGTPTVDPNVSLTPTIPTTAVSTPTPSPSPTGNGSVSSPTPLPGNATPTRTGGGNSGPVSPTPQPSATPAGGTGTPEATATSPGGVPTSPPGTVVPATLEPTRTPNSYGGGSYP